MWQPRGSGAVGNHSGSMQDCSVAHTAAIPLPPFHREGAVSRERLSPRGCAPRVLVEGSRSGFAGQVAALQGDLCLPCRARGLSTAPRGGGRVSPAAFRARQSSGLWERSCQAGSGGAAHTLQLSHRCFPVFNKVHCRKADAEAPGSGAQQLILQTSCLATSGGSRHPLLPRLLKMEHRACGKHHSGIYPGPEMVLATSDPSQIPWTRIKPLGSRWEVMNLLSLQQGNQGWSDGVPSGGKPRSRGRAAHSGTEPPKHLDLTSSSPWLEQLQKFPFFPDSGSCV